MKVKTQKQLLLLVDGHSLAFRSFYAFSKGGEGGLTTKDGFPTSVTYGFLKSLLDNCKVLSPQGITIAFDTPEPTFRHNADPNYKANRDVAPEKFFQDLEKLQLILENDLNVSTCTAPGYEADDVLGTLANRAADKGWCVRILSGDRDLFQLVDDKRDIAILYMGGGPYAKSGNPILIKEEGVKQKLGVIPKKVIDLKALTGDSSDNIPGVKGVGPKTAINLLNENDNLDGVYKSLQEIETNENKEYKGVIKGAVKIKLRTDKDNAYLSRKLAEILINIPIEREPRLNLEAINKNNLIKSLKELELFSLERQVEVFEEAFSKGGYLTNKKVKTNTTITKDLSNSVSKDPEMKLIENETKIKLKPTIITNEKDLEKLVTLIKSYIDKANPIALDTETTSLNPFKAELVGIGLCWGEQTNDMAYIPIGHEVQNNLVNKDEFNQLNLLTVINYLEEWLTSNNYPKVLQNTKYDRLIFLRHGISLGGVVLDTLLADYINDSSLKHNLKSIAERELNISPDDFNSIVKKGQTFANIDINTASLYCGMDVYLTRKIGSKLLSKLREKGNQLIQLLYEVEQPLEKVLAEMESTGITIDIPYLENLSKELSTNIIDLEKKAYKAANKEFNLSSPKQLGEVLFEDLNLDRKKSRKTKTGWSTDANVLERLEKDHPIIPFLIEHRTLSKLLSTYVDSLPLLVEEETNRIHTDFNQAVTTTGRLSSSNPNLQNIPIRTVFSRRIRKAFLPQRGWDLISADYSQIELRILAHLSGEEVLQEAYKQGEDVHALTAKLLLDKQEITPEERRIGKTINFGVIYGMGPQRLSRATGMGQNESKDFLNIYKKKYPKIFAFLEKQELLALTQGYVKTILGRRRYFNFDQNGLGRLLGKDPEDVDLKVARRAGIEAQQLRAAANAPIQGSSADIIKIAMVHISRKLKENKLSGRLLLQVHDELVIESDPKETNEVKRIVTQEMEGAVQLSVPLVIDIGVGQNWMDAK